MSLHLVTAHYFYQCEIGASLPKPTKTERYIREIASGPPQLFILPVIPLLPENFVVNGTISRDGYF
jgi:hypothetical protein